MPMHLPDLRPTLFRSHKMIAPFVAAVATLCFVAAFIISKCSLCTLLKDAFYHYFPI